jgi:hypothetical protein
VLRGALSAIAIRAAPWAYRRLKLARQLTRSLRNFSTLRHAVHVGVRRGRFSRPHIVAIGRKRNRIRVAYQDWMIVERPNELFHRSLAVLAIVAGAPLECFQLVADISDGEDSGRGLISFCSRDPGAILIPDHIFVRTRGYEEHRRLARANATAWNARSDQIIWRGQTTGPGTISRPHLFAEDPDLLARVRLCLTLKNMPGTDVKLSAISHSNNNVLDTDRLASAGILGEFISPVAWHGLKFAIDIDGHSNAWSNLFTRLIMGCCVLKVASALGFRQCRSAVHGVAIMDRLQAGDIGTAKFVGTARRFCSASSRSARWRYSRNDTAIGGKGRAGSGHQRSLDHDRSVDRRGLTLRTVCESLTKDEQRPLKQKDERQIDSHGLTPVVDVRLRHHAEHMVA